MKIKNAIMNQLNSNKDKISSDEGGLPYVNPVTDFVYKIPIQSTCLDVVLRLIRQP